MKRGWWCETCEKFICRVSKGFYAALEEHKKVCSNPSMSIKNMK